ncbi:MAG: extracellular solute-binding protein [Lachnospiraceae bacterium]|nr:extracellular solute-binding protein [Lachnospiraceae bacterium]
MKRGMKLFLLFCVFVFLFGCGKKKKYDLQVEYNALVFSDMAGYRLGQQYYQGEEILIEGTKEGVVRLLWDGRAEEILMRNVPESLLNIEAKWWLDSKGNPYVLYRDRAFRLNQSGEVLFEAQVDGAVTDICESASGEIVLKINAADKAVNGLAVWNMDEGTVGETYWLKDITYCIAKGYAKDILIVDTRGICDYGLSDGSKEYYIEWSGTGYSPAEGAEDIKFVSDNQIELYTVGNMVVKLSKINPEESGKTILTYKTTSISSEIKELIVRFNKENPDYYIMIEERPASQDLYTFREKIEIEIAAGHGPDIIDDLSVRNPYTLIEKGVIEELTPYIEESGIDREAYFPMIFQGFGVGEGTYGIGIGAGIHSWCVDGSLFASEEDFSLESMLHVLEGLHDDKIFMNGYDAASLVYNWLCTSEDLYGMVDWETGQCDFSGENFRRILELAMRYGDGEGKGTEGYIVNSIGMINYSFFSSYDASIKGSGRVLTGYPGERAGMHEVTMHTLAINAASENKDGAWEFLCFLLQEEVQAELGRDFMHMRFPVNRQAFYTVGNEMCGDHIGVTMRALDDPEWEISAEEFTEGQLEDLNALFAKAVFFPWRTREILSIIEEETALYFDGSKGMEETIDIIQNRVQLYLDEQTMN